MGIISAWTDGKRPPLTGKSQKHKEKERIEWRKKTETETAVSLVRYNANTVVSWIEGEPWQIYLHRKMLSSVERKISDLRENVENTFSIFT